MKLLLSIVLTTVFFFMAAGSGIAQTRPAGPTQSNGRAAAAPGEYSSLINDVFAPITEKLKLTNEQKLQVMAIIIETEVRAAPWLETLKQTEQQLSQMAFSDPLNEAKLLELCDQQAALLSDLIQMKVRAKANIYSLLTPEQRALVAREFRLPNQLEGHLGSISIY
ncbi:MAG TPA: Spy/CpxP family protein refolding chaperone [Pyrinomonadaceae bacterium]|jgi:Spy/CpxP family protein refolding chaperone|nr:Spy/CpxP family protein refolding chaperone [Pyrinomonadaceae bacterium]